jgi:hypothetical protein
MDTDPPWLARLRTLATALDESVPVPGTGFRIGIDPLLGLLPVVGDVAAGALSLVIVAVAAWHGVRKRTLVRMLGNIAADTLVGSVPVVGDLFDAYWKANVRNVDLAAADLERRA